MIPLFAPEARIALAKEGAVAVEPSKPTKSMLYPIYKWVEAADTALRLKHDKARLAIRVY